MNGAKPLLRADYVEASGRQARVPLTIPNAFATHQSSNILDRYGIGQINIIFVSGNRLVKHGWHKYFGKKQHIKITETMWQEEDNKLKKSFSFKDFRQAFAFMNKVADVVNEMDHHPYWTNMYNKVSFELNTHDAGDTVTEKDHKLAAAIDRIYNA